MKNTILYGTFMLPYITTNKWGWAKTEQNKRCGESWNFCSFYIASVWIWIQYNLALFIPDRKESSSIIWNHFERNGWLSSGCPSFAYACWTCAISERACILLIMVVCSKIISRRKVREHKLYYKEMHLCLFRQYYRTFSNVQGARAHTGILFIQTIISFVYQLIFSKNF